MDVNTLLTAAGLAPVVSIVTEVVLRALAWTGPTKDRYGPLLAIAVALLLVIPAAFLITPTGTTIFSAVLLALITGAGAMGVHDTVSNSLT